MPGQAAPVFHLSHLFHFSMHNGVWLCPWPFFMAGCGLVPRVSRRVSAFLAGGSAGSCGLFSCCLLIPSPSTWPSTPSQRWRGPRPVSSFHRVSWAFFVVFWQYGRMNEWRSMMFFLQRRLHFILFGHQFLQTLSRDAVTEMPPR